MQDINNKAVEATEPKFIKSTGIFRILLLEPHPIPRRAFNTILQEEGYMVIPTVSSHEAIEIFYNDFFDIIITDLSMPKFDRNGLDFFRSIKNICPEIPVVIVTAYSPYTKEDLQQAGAFDMIIKPFDRDEFTETVIRAIKTSVNLKLQERKN